MNITLIIISLGVFALLIIAMASAKNKKKKKIDEFLAMGKEHGFTFSQYEIGNWFSMGLDEKSPGILVVNQQKPEEILAVDLSKVKQCKATETSTNVSAKTENHYITSRIDLVFHFKDKNATPLSINFYNIDESFQISDELQLAKKWEKIINSVL